MGLDITLVDTEKSPKYPTNWYDERQLQEYKNSKTSSQRYPEHTWTPVYLRSSYNDSGFNHVVHNLTGMDLYYVFEPGDEYDFAPDWEACWERAQQMLEKLKEQVKVFPYRCSRMETEHLRPQDGIPKTEKEALDRFKEKIERERLFSSFCDASGEYYLDEPLPVSALIRGKGFLGNCIYIVYKVEEGLKWYVEAAEILVYEFIPLGIQYKDTARLCWSS